MLPGLAALTVLRLAVAAAAPLMPDETYYWVWSRALAPGYLDHPPMVALWVAAGTALSGDGALGVRLLAPLAAALGSLLLAQAGDDLLGRPAGVVAATLLNATLLFGVGAVTMTPDTPLLLFWTAALWALARVYATGRAGWWLVAGVAAGLALDSKYTGFLLLPAALAWMVWTGAWRRWQPWAGALIAAALFAPVLAWNAAHHWISFAKQGGRAGDWNPYRAYQFIAELLAGQVGLATPLLAVLFGAGMVVACRRIRAPAWALLAALTVLPAAVFVQHSLGDRVQGNWPAIIYPGAAIAAAGLAGRWTAWRRPAIALGGTMTALAYAQATLAVLPLPQRLDLTLRLLGGWPALAVSLAATARDQNAEYLAVEPYGDAAELARALPAGLPVLATGARWASFELPDAHGLSAGRPGLLLRAANRAEPPDPSDWSEVAPLPDPTRVVAARYHLYRVIGRPGGEPLVVLPRLR